MTAASASFPVILGEFRCDVIPQAYPENRPFYSYGGGEVDGDLVLIQTFMLYYVNQVILMLTSSFQEQFP